MRFKIPLKPSIFIEKMNLQKFLYAMSIPFSRFLIKIPTRYGWLTTYCTLGGISYAFGRPSDKPIEHAFTITPGSIIFDVGAHIGWYTLKAAKKAGWVWSFEPEPKNYSLLKRNTQNKANVLIWNLAISNQTGEAYLNLNENPVAHSLIHKKAKGITVETITLDALYASGIVPSLVKIDVEGAELLVLEGAKNLLAQVHPRLIIETDKPQKIAELLKPFGYELYPLTKMDYLAENFDSAPAKKYMCKIPKQPFDPELKSAEKKDGFSKIDSPLAS